MSPKNHNNPPKHLKLGQTGGAQPTQAPIGGRGGGGQIKTNLPEIKWTRRKLTLVVIFLSIPYTAAIAISFGVGNVLIGSVLIALGLFILGMYFLLRFLENADL